MTVAPHRSRELELVLDGTKPLASVEEKKDPDQFWELQKAWARGEVTGFYHAPGEIVFSLPDNFPLVYLWKEVMRQGTALFGRDTYQRVMGKLYGYSDEDIETFIANGFDCDCSKCRGAEL